MNGLAQLAALSDHIVTGSDRAYSPESEPFNSLIHLGIRIFPQDGSGITPETTKVVYSTAIEAQNPELLRARELNIPLLHRAEFLHELVGTDELIAVAGTAGKTTTTGLLGWIFECLGLNPSVYNGAALLNWKKSNQPGNIRKGTSTRWIIEADESDKSFLQFRPTHSIITNISKDHYELDELQRMFDQFRQQTSGVVIDGSSLKISSTTPNTFTFRNLEFRIRMPGRHNLENALCAVSLCEKLGLDLKQVSDAVASFNGIERRMETVGSAEGITIIDDYAHNPAKIQAALAAASTTGGKVHAYWRPHGFTPLFNSMEGLVQVFSRQARLHGGSIFILPVYYSGGTVERKVTSEDLVAQLNEVDVPAQFVADYAALKYKLESRAKAGDIILGMGARDPELPQFSRRLVKEWKMS